MNTKVQSVLPRIDKGQIPFGSEAKLREWARKHRQLEENQKAQDENKERLKQLIALSTEDSEAGFKAKEQLNRLRVDTVWNYVQGSSNAGMFFEHVDLADDEAPVVEVDSGPIEVEVDCIGDDGGLSRVQVSKQTDQAPVPMKLLSTEEVEFLLEDLYHGNVADHTKNNVRLAFDLERQIDQLQWAQIDRAIGDFDLDNEDRAKRTLNLHSSVRIANVPTTNLLTPDSKGANSFWELDCLIEVWKYMLKWQGVFEDGDLRATDIFVPSVHLASGMIDKISLDNVDNILTRQLQSIGNLDKLGPVEVNLVGDATLDPAKGRAYVRFNKPIGWQYSKSSRDKLEIDDSSYEAKQKNKGRMFMQKAFGSAVPCTHRPNVAAIQYRNEA